MFSPRGAPETPRSANRAVPTLGNLGAFIPRPAATAPAQPRQVPQEQKQQEQQVPSQCPVGGVIYERDGFEVFFGLGGCGGSNSGGNKPILGPKEKRDGFDKFFGIRSADKCPSLNSMGGPGASREDSIGCKEVPPSAAKLGGDSAGPGCRAPATVRKTPAIVPPIWSTKAKDNEKVQTFSVATPLHPFVPPFLEEAQTCAESYSMQTPMPPPPVGSALLSSLLSRVSPPPDEDSTATPP